MARTITESDVRELLAMRAEIRRLAHKVDSMRGPVVVRNTRDSLVLGAGPANTEPDSSRPRMPFMVRVTQTGGSAGTSAAQCSFTYSVYAWSDTTSTTTIGTVVSMKGNGQRPETGKMIAGSYGLAFYETDGSIKLLWVDEKQDTGTGCT